MPLTQSLVELLASERALTLIAGRYEGFDEAWLLNSGALQISIGDYVLSGGELAAAVLIDALVRLLPGVLGSAESAELDSFSTGLLDYPNFAQEPSVRRDAPALLHQGHHTEVQRWRRKQALLRTLQRRPDLLARLELSTTDRGLLQQALHECRRLVQ
jgi:tRNA (Guanine37-N(1)-) methyltransferase (EC 2.1.1.31)